MKLVYFESTSGHQYRMKTKWYCGCEEETEDVMTLYFICCSVFVTKREFNRIRTELEGE